MEYTVIRQATADDAELLKERLERMLFRHGHPLPPTTPLCIGVQRVR